jgi:phage shock protein PspC (stress-responsive transcriptional regulator)
MKKNISINISGIIFHIEEDGYEKLKDYLESINRYFSTFEDSLEIIADIESRIAEIFLARLRDGKQVITIDDVESLIATMGSIKDFQAAEEESAYISRVEAPEPKAGASEPVVARRLYRDNKRKLLGGVLAGLAHYFSIDPIWMRLFYLLLFFGVSVLPSSAGILLLAYIVMWIVVPGSDQLVEEKKLKKMYRNPDSKVLGGVAGGIAAYFGIDVVIVRLLFVAGIFIAFAGPILYIILWIILPEAKTLTDKMEMQGQPVTLSNIESTIKKSLNVEGKEENLWVKILLFPFRLLAALISFLSKALGPFLGFLAEAARILFGVLFILMGILFVLAVLIVFGAMIGLFASGENFVIYNIPLDILRRDIQFLPALAAAVTLIIPFLFLAILGFRVIMRQAVISSKLAWTLFALWVLSFAGLSLSLRPVFREFSREGRFSLENTLKPSDRVLLLRFQQIGRDELNAVSLAISAQSDSLIHLDQTFSALGSDRQKGIDNAGMVLYPLEIQDTVLTFPSRLAFAEGAKFRKQELRINLVLPYGQRFRMDPGMRNLLGNYLYRNGFSNSLLADHTWYYTEDGLQCLDCPESEPATGEEEAAGWSTPESDAAMPTLDGYSREYDMTDFYEVEVHSPIKVYVKRSGQYRVVLNGRREDVNEIVVDKSGDRLSIEFRKGLKFLHQNTREVTAYIFMPEVHRLAFGGASRSFVSGFAGDELEVVLHGAAACDLDVQAKLLTSELNGASKLNLSGRGDEFRSNLSGAASLYGFNYEVKNATIDASSASVARVSASENLQVKSTGNSRVRYRGDAQVEIDKSGAGSVQRED